MSDLTGDDVVRLKQLLRHEEDEARRRVPRVRLATVAAAPAEEYERIREASPGPHEGAAVPRPRRYAPAHGPAWLQTRSSEAHTKDFPAVPAVEAAGTGRHRPNAPRIVADTKTATLTGDMQLLSAGSIRKIRWGGPVLAKRPARRLRRSTFSPIMSTPDRLLIAALSLGWVICLTGFWAWWLQPSHRTSVFGLAINSVVLIYVTVYPVFFVIAANRLRNVRKSVAVPLLRTAFVVTRAPSEPWDVAKRTLTAMLDQDLPLPYDVWICDERPTAEIIDWCAEHGVIMASRHGRDDYHRSTWPRRTKCKEGNLAYFYDHWGYGNYDVVAQLDCDHQPSRSYLSEIVRPFSDPAIGYVSAPSVCDTNAAVSWAARGRLYREATFHGAFQLGHSDGWAPACIGSHYAVRTRALRDIGGIGPELAEISQPIPC